MTPDLLEQVRRLGVEAAAEGLGAEETATRIAALLREFDGPVPSGGGPSTEESARERLVDDLIRGDVDLSEVMQRAEPFGVNLSGHHRVALVTRRDDALLTRADLRTFARAVREQYGDRDVLVALRPEHLVAVVPAGPERYPDAPARTLHDTLRRLTGHPHWRIAMGRSFPEAHGVARSFQEARESLDLALRLHPDEDLVPTRDLLMYRVLGRDRGALTDLVASALGPLQEARGGAAPLVETLEAYFASGEVATLTARRLHVSVRTVTYRLARITQLTGYDPTDPRHRLTLHIAVLGARLLPWEPATATRP